MVAVDRSSRPRRRGPRARTARPGWPRRRTSSWSARSVRPSSSSRRSRRARRRCCTRLRGRSSLSSEISIVEVTPVGTLDIEPSAPSAPPCPMRVQGPLGAGQVGVGLRDGLVDEGDDGVAGGEHRACRRRGRGSAWRRGARLATGLGPSAPAGRTPSRSSRGRRRHRACRRRTTPGPTSGCSRRWPGSPVVESERMRRAVDQRVGLALDRHGVGRRSRGRRGQGRSGHLIVLLGESSSESEEPHATSSASQGGDDEEALEGVHPAWTCRESRCVPSASLECMCRNIRTLHNFEPPATTRRDPRRCNAVRPQGSGYDEAVSGQRAGVRRCNRSSRGSDPAICSTIS